MQENTDQDLNEQTEAVLRRLHIGGQLAGFRFLLYAIAATVIDPTRTRLITKDLYREIARTFGVKPAAVERSIRTAVMSGWKDGRLQMSRIAGYWLRERPSNREFIDLVAYYLRQH